MDGKTWTIGRLTSEHDRKNFSCGNDPLDRFLKTLASQYHKRRLGKTYVATEPGSSVVVGFYTASAGSVPVSNLPEQLRTRLPNHPVPSLHLGRVAVDQSTQGQGLGKALLFDFFSLAASIAARIGVTLVDVVAKDEPSKAFYERYGFARLEDDAKHLYLPVATIEKILGSEEGKKDRK